MQSFFRYTIFVFLAFLIGFSQRIAAQGVGQNKSKFIRSLQKTTWIGGLSGTVIDDDGKAFKDFLKIKDSWNFLDVPSKIDFEGYKLPGFSIGGTFTYSQLQQGKPIGSHNVPRPKTVDLVALDAFSKLYPNELSGDVKNFCPYVSAGFGVTYRSLPDHKIAITANLGFGANLWIYKGFGLNVQTMAKFALNKASSRNYLQHSVGAVYRFNLATGIARPNHRARRYNLFSND